MVSGNPALNKNPPIQRVTNTCLDPSRRYLRYLRADTKPSTPCRALCIYGEYLRMGTEHANGRMGTVPAIKFVVLLRVSTKHQGADGLGIEAQKRDIELFLSTKQGAEVIA